MNDNGFVITSNSKLPIEQAVKYLKSAEMRAICEKAIDNTEVLNRRFRHCATRALMILRSYKGRVKTAGRQQMSSRLLITAVKRIDDNFSILKEARREVLEEVMDIESATRVVQGIEAGLIKAKVVQSELPSPFAFNVFLQGRMDIMKMEDRLAFIRRMHGEITRKIGEKD
jgi:ATP-dependent Lhr-like helicase